MSRAALADAVNGNVHADRLADAAAQAAARRRRGDRAVRPGPDPVPDDAATGYLIFAGAIAPEATAYRTAYAGGLMMLAALLAGGCAPALILAWTRPDPDPES